MIYTVAKIISLIESNFSNLTEVFNLAAETALNTIDAGLIKNAPVENAALGDRSIERRSLSFL